MTADEYWHGDPYLMLSYEEAYKIKQQIKENELWAQGAYVKQALQSTILVAGLADKSIAGKMPKYPDPPERKQQESLPMTEERIDNERLRAEKYFDALMKAHNSR